MTRTTYATLAAQLLTSARPDRTHLVGVDGRSGSGKTTFARYLSRALCVPVLRVDDMVPGWDGLAESVELLSEWVLRPLSEGRPARWRRYDWVEGRPGTWIDVPAANILVVEGCGVGTPPAVDLYDFLVWVETPDHERRARLEVREDWPIYEPFADMWARQERAVQRAAPARQVADLVVDGSDVATSADPEREFTVLERSRR